MKPIVSGLSFYTHVLFKVSEIRDYKFWNNLEYYRNLTQLKKNNLSKYLEYAKTDRSFKLTKYI